MKVLIRKVLKSFYNMCVFMVLPGDEARKTFDAAQTMLKNIINSGLLKAHGVVAFYRANSVGDDIEVYGEDGQVIEVLYGLRQQVGAGHRSLEGE